jgi:hypothetical protein
VVLRLQAGSTEAGYLAAIFPLPKTPTLVIIRNGELKEYIVAGVSKADFINRTAKALGVTAQPSTAPATSTTPSQGTPSRSSSLQGVTPAYPTASTIHQSTTPAPAPAPAPTSSNQPSSSSPSPAPAGGISNARVQTLLTERAARLEAQRKQEAERRRVEAQRKKEEDAAKPKIPDAQSKHLDEIKKRQRQEREARARILQQIEDDKAARRAQREESKQQRAAGASTEDVTAPSQSKPIHVDGNCKLQVRLFDGSTVRGQFPASHRLGSEVRKWVDEAPSMDGVGVGYAFKVIQTPMPSRSIDVGEEGQTLAELGLAPSATLVLVPAKKGTVGAYPAAGGNVLSRIIAFLVSILTGLLSFVTTMFSTAPAPAAVQSEWQDQSAAASGRDQGRKGGMDRLRERRDQQQFYNGNSVKGTLPSCFVDINRANISPDKLSAEK